MSGRRNLCLGIFKLSAISESSFKLCIGCRTWIPTLHVGFPWSFLWKIKRIMTIFLATKAAQIKFNLIKSFASSRNNARVLSEKYM